MTKTAIALLGLAVAGAVATGVALNRPSAPPKPTREYITVQVAGSGGLSASWQVGTRPAVQDSLADGTYTAWHGWLQPGTLVQASAKTDPVPPWLGPTTGSASCTIYSSSSPALDRLMGDNTPGVTVSTGYYLAPTASAIYGTPATCQYTVGQ